MNGFVIVLAILMGIALIGAVIVAPILEFLNKKDKLSSSTLTLTNLVVCIMWGIGAVGIGISTLISDPQSSEASAFLLAFGGLMLAGIAIAIVLDARDRRKLQTSST